jgi:cytochrome c553
MKFDFFNGLTAGMLITIGCWFGGLALWMFLERRKRLLKEEQFNSAISEMINSEQDAKIAACINCHHVDCDNCTERSDR